MRAEAFARARALVWLALFAGGCFPQPPSATASVAPAPSPPPSSSTPPPAASTASAAPAPIASIFTLAAEGAEGVDLDFFPAGDNLFVLSDAPQGLFAIAEPGGLHPLPELARGKRSTTATQKVERLIGTWPGTLWIQTLDVEQEVRPADPPWTTRLFRFDGSAWKASGDTKSDTIYWATWTSGPGCLVGVRGPNKVARNERRAADCPGKKIPVRPLADPSGSWVIRQGAATSNGDAILFEESYGQNREYRIEVVRAVDPPAISAHLMPLPEAVRTGETELSYADRSLLIRSPDDVYFRAELVGKPDAQKSVARERLLLHFDGKAFSRVDTPPGTGEPVLAVAADGTLVLAVSGAASHPADFEIWQRPPGATWKTMGVYRAPEGQGRWHAYDIWARSADDIWVACGRRDAPQGSRWRRVLRTGPVQEVWRPARAGSP